MFDAKQVKQDLLKWIQDYFNINGQTSKAVIGISGGIDSSLVLALCVEALGKDRVYGVLMPCGKQEDIDYSYELVNHYGIDFNKINIEYTLESFYDDLINEGIELNNVLKFNTPARLRMMTLYAVSASVGGRVSCNCNRSEDYVGYSTKFGDDAGDFAPLKGLLKKEVIAVAKETDLPKRHIEKIPIDGLCGKSDEENMGFSYDILDKYIETGVCEDTNAKEKIDKMHQYGLHKINPIPYFSV